MACASAAQSPATEMNEHIARLERIMRDQLQGHELLLECIHRKREAVRTADLDSIASICQREHTIVQRLAEMEKARLELIGKLTEALDSQAKAPLTVSRIAEAIDDPVRSRLCALAEKLRCTVLEARQASSVVRAATEALARHMTGIMQTVQSVLSQARVYSHSGRIAAGAQYQFCVDVTS